MRTHVALALSACVVFVHASVVSAQIVKTDARVAYGHHHLHVTNVDAHKKFWVEALGGALSSQKLGTVEIVHFPNGPVWLQPMAPTAGGTKGTVVDHLGFNVQNLRATVDRVKAAGFAAVTKDQLPPSMEVKDDVAFLAPLKTSLAFVMGPDNTLVELIEDKMQAAPIVSHHVHFHVAQVDEMKAWYAKTFGAKAAKFGPIDVQELPGVVLMFQKTAEPVVTTKDHVLDHIGFEVKNLEEFCTALEASGLKLDRPFRKTPAVSLAFLTDPWGTVIELTEGLGKY